MDPPKDLSEALKEKEIPEDSFFIMKHGETRVIKWKNDNHNWKGYWEISA